MSNASPFLFVHFSSSSGSVYSEGSLAVVEMGYSYLTKVLQFYRIQFIEAVFVEGTASLEKAPAIKEKAMPQADFTR